MKIPVSHGHLEAQLKEPSGPPRGAAVLCHPHPLFGGTMHTKAVYRAAQALNEIGLSVLRFNFRGVGASTGSYDAGTGEREDVIAALDWLEKSYPNLPLLVGGFSFGSMVGLAVGAEDKRIIALLGLGLVIGNHYDYTYLSDAGKPVLVVQGEEDEFGSGEQVEALLAKLGKHITLMRVPDADHYFTDQLDALKRAIRDYYESDPVACFFATVYRET